MKDAKHLYLYKDMFNKYNLIKKINKYYELYFDAKNKLFIILNSANYNEICLNFNDLCINIEKTLQKTLVQNSKNIFFEIENDNDLVYKKQINQLKQDALDKLFETSNLINRSNKILQSDINKILGVNNV